MELGEQIADKPTVLQAEQVSNPKSTYIIN